jgi:hypothetical protein
VCAAFREGDTEQDRPAVSQSGRGQGREADALGQLFSLIEHGAGQDFKLHTAI